MKYLIFIFLLVSTGLWGQTRINELPAKTNADSTWLILTGNPNTGRLYKMNFDNLKDSVIGATGSTFDSTSLSNRIDLKLNATDTASLSARINAIGVGGGEDLDATLAIGNTTDEQVIFHDNLGATPASTSYIPIIIRPLENDPDQLDFRFERNTTFQNGGTTINNEVLNFGFNVNAQTPGLPGLYESWESGYYPGADRWLEKHEVYAKSDLTQVRLSSYTINTATNDIDFYHTVNRFYLNDSVGNYFKVESNVSTDASKLTLTSTDGTAGLQIETNGTDNAVYISSLINTSSSELQFSAFEFTKFNNDVQADRIGVGVAPSSWLFDVKGTGLQISGNFYSNFRVVNETPDRGFYFGYDSTVPGSGIIASNADYLAFWTYNGSSWGERLRIRPSGILNLSNAPTYADDTAAGAGGLVAGDIFKTAAGDLKIKL